MELTLQKQVYVCLLSPFPTSTIWLQTLSAVSIDWELEEGGCRGPKPMELPGEAGALSGEVTKGSDDLDPTW